MQPPCSLCDCANLAVAGTGSSSLLFLLNRAVSSFVAASRTNYSRDCRGGCRGFVSHRHQLHAETLYQLGARCFVVTIRDPAERLVTAVAWERASYRGRAPRLFAPRINLTSPSAVVDAFRRKTHVGHDFVHHLFSRNLHNDFLIPQSEYVEHAQVLPGVRLHLLCTEHLAEQWAEFVYGFEPELRAFQDLPPSVPPSLRAAWKRNSSDYIAWIASPHHENGHRTAFETQSDQSLALTVEERSFVRESLFKEDTLLWRRACFPG